jgi:hypothetical protein
MTPEDRAWEVVRRAFEERPLAQPRPRAGLRLAVAASVVVLAAIVLAAFSPPGHAVFEQVRQAVGVEHAAPALVSLPTAGPLLVTSRVPNETWLVEGDGLRRTLGGFSEADWSPHGLFVIATKANALVALDPHGRVRWELPRIGAHAPRWEGTLTDTRIAYLTTGGLRVVAGDGSGDHLLDARSGNVAPAWDPGRLHVLAYDTGREIVVRHDDGKPVWRTRVDVTPTSLAWSSDGRYLAVFSARKAEILDAHGTLHRTVSLLEARALTGAFRPHSHDLALVVRLASRSEVELVHVDRPGHAQLLFAGPGRFGDLAWSPDGKWLLVAWPAANQWVFIHGRTVRAVGNIRAQFATGDRLRWCCPLAR